MAKNMKRIAALTTVAAICFAVLYRSFGTTVFLTLAITFGTTAYHFCIRLLIGTLFQRIKQNKADYTKHWYQVGAREQALYEALGVRQWKNKMPTYDPDTFDISKHSWEEIAQATCQSELVHETNIVFSFVPIVFSIWFGALAVFLITSLLSAAYDLLFVIMQRYNRPRILKIINRKNIT